MLDTVDDLENWLATQTGRIRTADASLTMSCDCNGGFVGGAYRTAFTRAIGYLHLEFVLIGGAYQEFHIPLTKAEGWNTTPHDEYRFFLEYAADYLEELAVLAGTRVELSPSNSETLNGEPSSASPESCQCPPQRHVENKLPIRPAMLNSSPLSDPKVALFDSVAIASHPPTTIPAAGP